MTPYSLTEILTQEERDTVFATLLAIAASLGAATTAWQPTSPLLTMFTTDAQKMSDLTKVAVEIAKGGFGDLLPSDAWADLWAQSRFNVQRVPADEAAGYLTITCDATALADSYDPGEIIVAHATTDKTYRNTAIVNITPSTVLTDQPFAADVPGTESNAAPTAISVLVSSLVGVTVSNPAAFLGTDKETTPALVDRARKKLGALSPNGPKDAYDYIARTPEYSATSVPITRTRTVASNGNVTTYIATAGGAPSGGDVTIVQNAIDASAEPWGTTATAVAATEKVVPVTYQVWISGSQLSTSQIQTAIENALAAWFASLDVGGYVVPPDTGAIYVSNLQQVIGTAVPGVQRVEVTLPAGTTVVAPNEVAVLGTITPTVTLL